MCERGNPLAPVEKTRSIVLISPQCAAYVFRQQHQVEFVGGAWLELGYEMKVEVAGIGGFGVYK